MIKKISNISWLLFILYIGLSFFTFISISYSNEAKQIFTDSEFLMYFNLIWFGLIIVIYGLYALLMNYKRISRLGLNEKLDTQFLIVLSFFFLTIHVILDFYLYIESSIDSQLIFAINSTSQVLLYGALMAGLFSIILPKIITKLDKN